MTSLQELRTVPAWEILWESERRQKCAREGLCAFCERPIESEPVCTEPSMHKSSTVNYEARLMNFDLVTGTNRARCERWHPGFPDEQDPAEAWGGADWSNAFQGEAGEAGNVVKKLRRIETSHKGRATEQDKEVLIHKLGLEMADTYLYMDLLATYYSIDLPAAIREKFNITSVEYDWPERL